MKSVVTRKAEPRADRKSVFLAAAISLSIALAGSVPSVLAAGQQPLSKLDKLELNYFHHTFSKEDTEERIDRLEKMVFGEAKDGSQPERLSRLVELVPNLDSVGQESKPAPSSKPAPTTTARETPDDSDDDVGQYPAVSAIEQKLFRKDFAGEKISQRLARLETRVFGKPSTSTDLSERTDRLKASTGVDITRQAPPGADWADEEEDIDFPAPPSQPVARGYDGLRSNPGADGQSFSGRDLRKDFQQ
ncbi:MAG: hypothetical protein KC777_28395, partial [Cyanobacteria bacterium HKST-UBA02]|nr:hypothetical protein [Cyanobacteria bacterium HKST-UBA02]